MNEPLRKKAEEIISNKSKKTIFGAVEFNSDEDAIQALIEFAKFYDKYEHEPPEEQVKDGNIPSVPVCAICSKVFNECYCGISL